MNFKTYQYTVAKEYVTALEYGDYSCFSLNSDGGIGEIHRLDKFTDSLPLDYIGIMGHFIWPEDEVTSFERCEISGLMADCVTVDYLVTI